MFHVEFERVQTGFLSDRKGKVIFHVEGPKTEKGTATNSGKSCKRYLEDESTRSSAERGGGGGSVNLYDECWVSEDQLTTNMCREAGLSVVTEALERPL